jgi:hypothetical protein
MNEYPLDHMEQMLKHVCDIVNMTHLLKRRTTSFTLRSGKWAVTVQWRSPNWRITEIRDEKTVFEKTNLSDIEAVNEFLKLAKDFL